MSNRTHPVADAQHTAQIVRHHARTFAAASWLLPQEKRRAAFAVYAFCRVADDIVDDAASDNSNALGALNVHRAKMTAAFDGVAHTPAFRELAWAIERFEIPSAPFHALLDMLCTDLQPQHYHTWPQLEQYCVGVASTVGEMCTYVFGMPASASMREEALRRARVLGVALQLTNILRDVGEDATRGRCYLPTEDLGLFGFTRDDILRHRVRADRPAWQQLMRFEIERARALYAEAAPGLELLDADAKGCAIVCARGYAEILRAIERRNYDSLSGRARVGSTRKLFIMFDAWRAARARGARAETLPSSAQEAPVRA